MRAFVAGFVLGFASMLAWAAWPDRVTYRAWCDRRWVEW